ncbi:MAG: 16S rRNA (guanine(966)-N(2))-methyltransferase RsmD [Candidatus Omnitrophica bacterium]|nr:16S rRNA (guanine(966)-N(2))-methyltransferase RsmD [Candidatus Omnitrophota bacterium]
MRILSGKYKGRVIKMPPGVRPTQDKVRKSFFDILKDCIEGVKFLDLFAGSGVMGIEALSRGASFCVFVEAAGQQSKTLRENLDLLGIRDALVLAQDAQRAIENLHKQKKFFDIVFLDPPYYQDMAKKTLQSLSDCDILTPKALVVVQHFKRDQLPEAIGKLVLWRISKYGDTRLSFYQRGAPGRQSATLPD